MKKYQIAAIGELNVDIILNGIESEPEIGKEKFCKDMTVTLGSSTAIFAANAAALGSKVCFVGLVGKDSFGELVKSSLAAKGVATHFIGTGDINAMFLAGSNKFLNKGVSFADQYHKIIEIKRMFRLACFINHCFNALGYCAGQFCAYRCMVFHFHRR